MSSWSPRLINKWPPGEKLRCLIGVLHLMVLNSLRVTASMISIVASPSTARNLLQGDHVTEGEPRLNCMVAITGSHENGTPCTTLTKG